MENKEKFKFEFPMDLPNGKKVVIDYLVIGKKNVDFILDEISQYTLYIFLLFIQKRLFTVNDADVSSKTLLHWRKMGLLLDNYTLKADGWAKFNFIDYLWLQVVKELRSIGISLEIIKQVKESLIDGGTPAMSFEDYRSEIENDKAYKNATADEKDEVADFLYSQNNVAKHFRLLMTDCLVTKANGQIIIFPNGGEAYFKFDGEDVLFKQYSTGKANENYIASTCIPESTLRYKTHIRISVTELILKYLILDKEKLKIPDLPLLSKQEKEIINYVRADRVERITVRKRNGKVDLMETTEQYKPAQMEARLKELFLKEDYQDLEIKKENGSAIFKRTVKHKI